MLIINGTMQVHVVIRNSIVMLSGPLHHSGLLSSGVQLELKWRISALNIEQACHQCYPALVSRCSEA